VGGFFDPLLAWLDRAVEEGFLKPQHRDVLMLYDKPESLLDALASHRPARETPQWIGRDDR
jgi:predicted Rossmann-fold nucleotide-binding protein